MFNFALRKMLKNRWLTCSLLIGYMMTVAIVSSMPLYSHAILNRLLQKDLETVQLDTERYPGTVLADQALLSHDSEVKRTGFQYAKETLLNTMVPKLGVPLQRSVNVAEVESLRMVHPEDGEPYGTIVSSFSGISEMMEHIQLIGGRLPAKEKVNGTYEAVISNLAAQKLGLGIGSVFKLTRASIGEDKKLFNQELAKVEIVGIFDVNDNSDGYWIVPVENLRNLVLIDYDLFVKDFVESEKAEITRSRWYLAMDYHAIEIENCDQILDTVKYYSVSKNFGPTITANFEKTLEQYKVRRESLSATLWIIEIPILLMLLLYIFMVSHLILEHEKNEIAVLRSRGTSNLQILFLYLFQSGILAGIAFLTGPFLGMAFCKIVGASDGFMSFVNRSGLKMELTFAGWGYALICAVCLVLTMFLSVILNRETSIVSLKRKKTRKEKALWQKLYLDVVCLAIAAYGIYSYRNRLQALEQMNVEASNVPVDFLLYGASTLFILGMTLLFLRIFPLLMRLVYRLGEKHWNPVLYLTFSQISRQGAANLTISMFLIFTLSMGVFNSVMVRTLNQNQIDRVCYMTGADINLQEQWPYTGGVVSDMAAAMGEEEEEVYYSEPQFSRFETMKTVKAAARVLTLDKVSISANSNRKYGTTVMGIVPDEFGRVCWYRKDLAPYHINEYLNLLAEEPRAALMSSNLMEEFGIQPGDTAYVAIPGNSGDIQVVVYAAIDYFPTYNPKQIKEKESASLLVMNLNYLQQEMKLEPYRVWLAKADGVSSQELYAELEEKKIAVGELSDMNVKLVRLNNDAIYQGTNGFFTLSFMVTMLITFIGFFIYWILAIRARRLQFGILRSMGMSKGSVMMVLLWEQILVSVTAVVVGIGVGTIAAELYAPFLECGVNPTDQVLPYIIVGSKGDYFMIVVIVVVMLTAAAGVLARLVDKLRASEALKLGED